MKPQLRHYLLQAMKALEAASKETMHHAVATRIEAALHILDSLLADAARVQRK